MATLLAVIFFIVALALPWYGIAERGTYSLPGSNTTSEGDLISSFYWTGFVIYINPKDGSDSTEEYSWNDLKEISGKSSNRPQTVYFACMALAGVSLVLSILVSCFIFCCLMRRSARRSLEESCGNCPKWSIFLASLLSFLTAVASWGALFAFPTALDDIDFLKCKGEYWCGSFVGSKDIGSDSNLYWAPSIGWVFAVMASVWGLIGCALALLVPKTHQYTLIN
ncbi:uncharacterized protein ACA1_200100 [Acanthamoeba castellanii str. Neff]|uniref:Transmembrane protein n=1 Tax=Acanthamoeba castellanii (strain ATCC 30010 / Neff) TaxID=1257118 RepID=L8H4Q8_ACACF|nr:uncharacterized protein ACA1_200100 [Acanthamoeba castellanii str. Neff]ELR19713.1 hypothetical protein ACA1_200100 [Acanthamoeba castellanii str. Neff]